MLPDGFIDGGTANETRWIVEAGELLIFGSDGNKRFRFGLTGGRGGELLGTFIPFEPNIAPLVHYLRPLGPAAPLEFGPLPITTSDLNRAAELARKRVDFSLILAPVEHVSTPVRPLTLDACTLNSYQSYDFMERHYQAAPFFVHVLHDVDLINGSVVVRRDDIVVGETVSFILNRIADLDHAMHASGGNAYLPINNNQTTHFGTSFLFNTIISNYGHWHLQSGCNAEIFHKLDGLFGAEIAPISLGGVGFESFRTESLEALGVDPKRVIRTPRDPSIVRERYERLIVPSALAIPPATRFHPQTIRALKTLQRQRTDGPRRLYLSRRDVGNARGILNTQELSAALAELGFVEIVTSEMTYEQELQAFANADVVVAPHGGGLTNMIAHAGGLKILELFHAQQLNAWYKNLAAICGHRYAAYCIDLPENEASKGWHGSFTVDVSKVMHALEKLIAI